MGVQRGIKTLWYSDFIVGFMEACVSPLRRWLLILLAAVAAVMTYLFLPATLPGAQGPVPVPEAARRTCAIFVVAVVFWATEVIPLYATSLCVIGMEVLFLAGKGGMGSKLPTRHGETLTDLAPASAYFAPFASGIIILFMGGFLLSAAVTKHRLDRKIAGRLLRPFARRPITLMFAVLIITAFFSMWMSNTATAVMMLAIIAPIVRAFPEDDRFHRAVILAVPFGANIGGIGTPIGTPPNAVALAALRDRFPGLNLGFVDWMIMAVPLAALLVLIAGGLLYVMFRPKPGLVMPEIEVAREPITPRGWATLAVLGSAILLWVFGSMDIKIGEVHLNFRQYIGLSSAAVALLAAAALTALGTLEKRDVDSIDWNVLILMWGGLSLGTAMQANGLIDVISALPFAQFKGLVLVIAVVVLALGMSTFMSNTATANVLVPMVIAIGLAGGIDASSTAVQLAVLTALACSFAMAMPVSTPPNAIAFATGKIPARAMIESGGVVSIVCVIVMVIWYPLVLPWFAEMVLSKGG